MIRSASELNEISRPLGHPKVGELSKKIDAVNPKREASTGKAIVGNHSQKVTVTVLYRIFIYF